LTLSELFVLLADVNRRDALIDLADGAFPDEGRPDFSFGMTSEFCFNAYGDPAKKEAMVRLAEEYYESAQPTPNYISQGETERVLKSVADIRAFLLTSRTEDPTEEDLKGEFTDEERNLSFDLKWLERRSAPSEPSYSFFVCLVDAKRYPNSGQSLYYSNYAEVQNDADSFIRRFVDHCERMKVFYGCSGFSLLFSTYSSSKVEAAYPVFRRFPGLLYAKTNTFLLDAQRRDDVIRDVNWLTAISDKMLLKAGGMEAAKTRLGPEIVIHPYERGVVFQAGPKPRLGDKNAGDIPKAYQAVNAFLKPLRFLDWTPPYYLRVPDNVDEEAATKAWISRFD
jgi:Protein of unknown function (DUF3396)